MPVKHIPGRRVGITEIPARLQIIGTIETPEERDSVRRAFDALAVRANASFEEMTAPLDNLCRHILQLNGATEWRDGSAKIPKGCTAYTVGYLLPSTAKVEASEVAYALEILFWLRRARAATDVDVSKKLAWTAGALAMEAHMKFRWEPHALRGEKNLVSVRTAAAKKGEIARRHSKARVWLQEVTDRRTGLTKEAVYARIERREGLKAGTVKKGISRLKSHK